MTKRSLPPAKPTVKPAEARTRTRPATARRKPAPTGPAALAGAGNASVTTELNEFEINMETFGGRAISVADDQLIEEEDVATTQPVPTVAAPGDTSSEIRTLSIAIFEEATALGPAQRAIATAGHTAAVAGTRDGLERVRRALADVDALLVALPGGEPLIAAALALAPRRPVVIAAVSGTAAVGVRRAAAAGADLVAVRPHDAERLAPVLLAAGRLADERDRAIAASGSEQLMRARLDALVEPEPGSLQPFEMFQRVLELELKRARRYGYPLAVALFAVDIPPAPPPGVRGILRARAGNALIHTIRDIDLATTLPSDLSRAFGEAPATEERFLVLLPYTELAGAALVARRVIAAVAEGDPVVAAGRSFAPRCVGAVAGAAPGQPLSFSRLMKDATRALEQARRDGAELAVPMPLG